MHACCALHKHCSANDFGSRNSGDSGLPFVAMTSNLKDWPLTMNVVVRDREAELPGGPIVTRAVRTADW